MIEPSSYRDCAVVYVSSKQWFANETLQSARTVRRAMPDIAIYHKVAPEVDTTGAEWKVFDHIIPIGLTHANIRKTCFLDDVAEEKVLYLDSDTYVVSGLRAAFDLLGRFEIACAHAPYRKGIPGPWPPNSLGILAAFPQLNGGVIFCRNSRRVRQLLRTWGETHRTWAGDAESAPDQPALRATVWNSDLSLYILPPEYNARLCFPTFLSGEAKILHCRFVDMEQVAARVNANLNPRVFCPEELGEEL